jgi:outer membrane biosynthesis protein TonB
MASSFFRNIWSGLTSQNQLDGIGKNLGELIEKAKTMSKELEELSAKVAANNSLIGSAVALINGISARIAAAADDPVALKGLSDELAAKDVELATAIAANTPVAAPEPAPAPVAVPEPAPAPVAAPEPVTAPVAAPEPVTAPEAAPVVPPVNPDVVS